MTNNGLRELYQIDWRIFIAGVEAWLQGRSPYAHLSEEFSAGAFAYPPTALTWLALFVPLGALGFYVWTMVQFAGWWLLIRERWRSHIVLLAWSPVLVHMWEGQSTLAIVLVLWAATNAQQRGWWWGMTLAWTLTKPHVAIIPVLWLLWQERSSPQRWRLWGGMIAGTLLLAVPPTLMQPDLWNEWIMSLTSYRQRLLQVAAWQGSSIVVVLIAAYLWRRSGRGGWQWWLAAALVPHTNYYSMVVLLPTLRPRHSYWTLGGIALAMICMGPVNELMLPWLLAGHLVAAWMINGGPAQQTAPQPMPIKPAEQPS